MFYVRAIAVYSKFLTFYGLVSFADLTAAVTTITVVSVSLEMFSHWRNSGVKITTFSLLETLTWFNGSRQFVTRY